MPVIERYKQLANDYIATLKANETALVVSPTHIEKDRITGEIRGTLKRDGRLEGERAYLRRARERQSDRGRKSRTG